MVPKDGGPAFPQMKLAGDYTMEGLSLRDYFAAQALAGVFAGGNQRPIFDEINLSQRQMDMSLSLAQIAIETNKRIAAMVYEMADAMLEARTT
jgi:hypothetical protein